MNTKKLMMSIILFVFMAICIADSAHARITESPRASTGSIPSGYSVTSNWHGINTPIGSTVTVTAVTTDNRVKTVTFLWRLPITDKIVSTDIVSVIFNGTVYVATSQLVVLTAGDWGVQALFQGEMTRNLHVGSLILARRATSFNVVPPRNQVPEAPTLGTVGLACVMSLGAGLYFLKKRKIGTL